MAEQVLEHAAAVEGPDGTTYRVATWGEARADGTWWGWLEFYPRLGGGPVLRTGEETTQPTRDALQYWASRLPTTDLEHALQRAIETGGV